jgi:voltage-dependent calcium channel T type alpha-1G
MIILYDAGMQEIPYWSGYSKARLLLHTITSSKYFDLAIAGVIGVNVITMAMEYYMMPKVWTIANFMSPM